MPALSTDDSSSANASPVANRRQPKWRQSPCHSPRPQSPPDRSVSTPPSSPTTIHPTSSPTVAAGSLSTPPAFASTMSTLRRNLSSQFSLIPEDRAVHITSVSRNGQTYQFRRETAAHADTPTSSDTVDAACALPRFTPTTSRSMHHMLTSLLLWWPLFLVGLVGRCFRLLFAAPFVAHPTHQVHQQLHKHPSSATGVPGACPSERSLVRGCAGFLLHLGLTVALNLAKQLIRVLSTPAAERRRRKRTVLIGGGSSIQALHLARNFQAAGYRVVAADVASTDGRLALAGFSAAVSRYYTLPPPPSSLAAATAVGGGRDRSGSYVGRLCDIVNAEHPVMYVPVCAQTRVQCDALAKPHLVLRGCQTFCPGAQESAVLDDLAELLHQCRRLRLDVVPPHRIVRSVPELLGAVYDDGEWAAAVRAGGRVLLHSMAGWAEPVAQWRPGHDEENDDDDDDDDDDDEDDHDRCIVLPKRRGRAELMAAAMPISGQHPWLVVLEPPSGRRHSLITCTTVRNSHIVSNVTCRRVRRRLVPDAKANANVERWLAEFFARVRLQRPIDGHMEFRFVRASGDGDGGGGGGGGGVDDTRLLLVGVRVGVSAAYICHTAVQTRVLMPPCRHFSRQRSGPLQLTGERYWMHAAVLAAKRAPTVRALTALVAGPLLDGGEALFALSDPLPWLAYCGWQLPRTLCGWWRHRKTTTTLTM